MSSKTRGRQGSKTRKYLLYLVKRPLAAFLATLAVGAGIALAIPVSNTIIFGPTNVVGSAVKLDVTQNLPGSLNIGEKAVIKFGVTTTKAVDAATLKMKIKSDPAQSLTESMATVAYKDPAGGAFNPVTLATSVVAGGTVLVGDMKTAWNINQGAIGTGEAEVTFNTGTPNAAYSIEVWVETGAPAGGGGAATGTSYTLGIGLGGANITYKSGTPPAGGDPAPAVDTVIDSDVWKPSFKVGETGTFNFTRLAGSHNLSLYPSTSLCATDIFSADCADSVSVPAAVNSNATVLTSSFTFTAPATATTAATEFHLVCNVHPDTMRTHVKVVP